MKKFLASRINFVEQSVIRKIFEKTPPNSINLGLGEIQFPTPQIFLEYGKEVLDEGYIRYTPNAGLLELRETIAKYYEDQISSANICVTNGAEEAVFASIFCYVNPGEEVMLANPTFVAYETIIKMAQGIPVYFDLNPDAGFRLDKNSFLDKLSSKTKMIILNNPSNPLGIGFSEEEIDFILDICKKKNILLVVDEVYRELFLERRPTSILNKAENVIIISGLSKSHCMTGWRLGWAVTAKNELIKPIINAHQYISTCAPYVSQKVAVKALNKKGMESVKILREKLKQNRRMIFNFFSEELADFDILPNQFSPYLFVNVKSDDVEFAEKLSKKGVIVIPGSAFGSNGEKWIRISYALEPEKLKIALERIKKYLQIF